MALWPRPGVSSATLERLLADVSDALQKATSHHDAPRTIEAYLRWAANSGDLLRRALSPHDLNQLVLTPRYWATLANPASTRLVISAVNTEMRARRSDLHAAINQVQQQVASWAPQRVGQPTAQLIPDTTVLLHHPQPYTEIDWHQLLTGRQGAETDIRIVLPLLVVDELDDATSSTHRSRARQTLTLLYEQLGTHPNERHSIKPRDAITNLGRVDVQMMFDRPRHIRLPRPDDELVDRTLVLQSFTGLPTYLITYDTGTALRATTAGLRAIHLEHANNSRGQVVRSSPPT